MSNHATNTTNDNASLGFDNMPVRFFCYTQDETSELDITECREETFLSLANEGYKVTYERHTIFTNGCRQICLTVENIDEPLDIDDLPTVLPMPNHGTSQALSLVSINLCNHGETLAA